MRAHEFITEKISLSNQIIACNDMIVSALESNMSMVARNFERKLNSHNYNTTYKSVLSAIQDCLNLPFEMQLASDLTKIGNTIIGAGLENTWFKQLGNDGHAGYDYISLNVNYLNNIRENILKKIQETLADNNAWSEDHTLENIQYAATLIKDLDITSDVIDNDMIEVFIHELVHIKQHTNQQKGKTEYRSYLTKNKDEFYKAIDDIGNGVFNDHNSKMHSSSPQEIPANAHSAAMEILQSLVSDYNTNSIENLNYIISYINGLFSYNELIHQPMVAKYIRLFNKSNYNEHKVLKKFIKLVYLELKSAQDMFIQKRDELQKEYDSWDHI